VTRGWIPLSLRRDSAAAEQYAALFDGVPDHLRWSLQDWVTSCFPSGYRTQGDSDAAERLLRAIELNVRVSVPHTAGMPEDWVREFVQQLGDDETTLLNVVDYLLSKSPRVWAARELLADTLEEGGSLWVPKMVDDRWELQERVGAEMESVLSKAVAPGDNASTHLAKAWSECFGRSPNAGAAYDDAVKSLEAAFQPIVSPKDMKATLGTIIRDIEQKPEKFGSSLEGKASGPEGVSAVSAMLKVIWQTQVRHGSGAKGAPTGVSIQQARDAVVVAASLVQLVRQSGFKALDSP